MALAKYRRIGLLAAIMMTTAAGLAVFSRGEGPSEVDAADSELSALNQQLSESEFSRRVLEARIKALQQEATQLGLQAPEAMIRAYVENHPDYQRQLAVAEEERHRFRENAKAWKNGGDESFLAEFKQRVETEEAELKAIEDKLRFSAVEALAADAKEVREEHEATKELQDEVQAKVILESMLKERIAEYRESQKSDGKLRLRITLTDGQLLEMDCSSLDVAFSSGGQLRVTDSGATPLAR